MVSNAMNQSNQSHVQQTGAELCPEKKSGAEPWCKWTAEWDCNTSLGMHVSHSSAGCGYLVEWILSNLIRLIIRVD